MSEGDTLLNAVLGAAVTVVLSFLGVSPLLGGGVAGYLQRGTRTDGAKVGALSGAIATLPVLLFAVLFVGVFAVAVVGGVPGGPELVILLLVAFPFVVVWHVGLGAVGGYLGVYVYEEFGAPRRRATNDRR